MTDLPDSKRQLLHLALDDLEKCEADPRYEIDMGEWHSATSKVCLVCLAGSVMAKSLECKPSEFLAPSDTNERRKLAWLDNVRTYFILPEGLEELDRVSYRQNPTLFKSSMRKIADAFGDETF